MNKAITLVIALILIVGAVVVISNPFGESGPSPFEIASSGASQDGSGAHSAGNEVSRPGVGDEAPDFELLDFEDNTVRLSDFRGKPVFIDFWTRWCPFCREEMPEIDEVARELEGELVVLGIHRTNTESLEVGRSFARDELGVSYPLLQDTTDEVYQKFSFANLMPFALYIDEEGIIRSVKAGPKTADEIREEVNLITARNEEE